MTFARLPLLPYLLTFAAGIGMTGMFPLSAHAWSFSIHLLLLGWVSWLAGWRRLTVGSLVAAVFFLGVARLTSVLGGMPTPGASWPGIPEGSQVYEGVVGSYPQETDRGFTFRCNLMGWEGPLRWESFRAAAQLTLVGHVAPERGDRIRFRASLRTPRNFGNDREFDSEVYSKTRGIDLTGTIGEDLRWVRVAPAQGWLRTVLNRVRKQAVERAEIYLQPVNASVWKSLVLGERIHLEPSMVAAFRSAGVIHLLVVSGFHVSVMALLFAFLASCLFRCSAFLAAHFSLWRAKALGAAFGALFFCLLTDLPIPTLRALLGVLLALLAVFLERPKDGLALWVAAGLGLLVFQPLFFFDLSAQLSFLAVLGIILALEMFPLADRGRHGWVSKGAVWLRGVLIITCGATLATLPVLLHQFSRFTAWSILGNYLFVPTLGSLGTPLGFVAAFLTGPLEGLGNFLLSCFDQLTTYVLPVVLWFRTLPASDLWVPRPSWISMVCYAGFLLTLYLWRTQVVKPKSWGALSLAFFGGIVLPFAASAILADERAAEVHFLHVGEGDATLATSEAGRSILIDAGQGGAHSFDAGERIIVPWLRVHGRDRLDVIAITHPDSDHAGGAKSVLDQLEVGELWLPVERGFYVDRLRYEAERRGIPCRTMDAETMPARWDDMTITVLYPPRGLLPAHWKSNDRSVVYRIDQDGFRTLITGDIEAGTEMDLLDRGADVRADLLKVAHHGSRTSSTMRFLREVRPRDAVITCGWKNHFGHPSPEVVARMTGQGVRIWRGDLCGEYVVQQSQDWIRSGPIHPCRDHLE